MKRVKKVLDHKHYPPAMFFALILVLLLIFFNVLDAAIESQHPINQTIRTTGLVISDSSHLEPSSMKFVVFRSLIIHYLIILFITSAIAFTIFWVYSLNKKETK